MFPFKSKQLIAKLSFCVTIGLCLIVVGCVDSTDDLNNSEVDYAIRSDDEYIAVFGDVQNYTYSEWTIKPFARTVSWIDAQNTFYGNFACILEVGDVTNHNDDEEWAIYQQTLSSGLSKSIPVYSCTGNHDYTWGDNKRINDRNSSLINKYLSGSFTPELIQAEYETGRIDNIIVSIPFKTRQMDLIILEYAPRKEVVQWAREWVQNHPDRNYILMTHEMLMSDGEIASEAYAWSSFYSTNSTWSSPKYIIDTLLKPNPNIIATVCGHNGHTAFNDSHVNCESKPIPIILFNLQYQKDGGDSQILLLRFPKDDNSFECITYHTDNRAVIETKLSGIHIQY